MKLRPWILALVVGLIGACATAREASPRTGDQVVRQAVQAYGGGVPFHGGWVLRQREGPGDVVFEVWFRPPAFRVEFESEGLKHPGEWVSDDGLRVRTVDPDSGEVAIAPINDFTNGVFPFAVVDPTQFLLPRCENPMPLGSETVLGRSATRLSCEQGLEIVEHWIDDRTGLILRADVRSGDGGSTGWAFTSIEFDPTFEPGTFDIGES